MTAYFPSWWTMVGIDCLMTVLAFAATVIVVKKWQTLRNAGAVLGCMCFLAGLWIGVSLYLADFWTMVFLPYVVGSSEAMAAMHTLHLKHSWYINTTSSILIFGGLVISISQISRQMNVVDTKGRALEESGNLLESIFENVPVGLLIKDATHKVERPNKTYLSWYGLNHSEMVGYKSSEIEEFQPEDDAVKMEDQEEQVLATGAPQTREVEREFADGKYHTVKITKFPIYGDDGRISKVGSVSVDLTELVMAKRGAEKALMKAELANRTKSSFLANMSHELRTPLNAIIGFSETLLAQIFGPLGSQKYLEQVQAIHKSGHHLLDLVNDILDMAKIESEEYELSPEAFHLSELVADTMQLVLANADRKSIRLTKDLPQPMPTLYADKRAMKQILLNLLSNAVKFTRDGGHVALKVSVDEHDLTIVVEDNGVGIPAEDLPNITKPFNQGARKSSLSSGEGTGLGLSIVASLVRQHNAKLDITSEVERGTSVRVFLPGVLKDRDLAANV